MLSRQNIADKTQANFVWRTGEFEKIRCEFGDCFYYEFNKKHTFSGFGDTMRRSTGKDGLLLPNRPTVFQEFSRWRNPAIERPAGFARWIKQKPGAGRQRAFVTTGRGLKDVRHPFLALGDNTSDHQRGERLRPALPASRQTPFSLPKTQLLPELILLKT